MVFNSIRINTNASKTCGSISIPDIQSPNPIFNVMSSEEDIESITDEELTCNGDMHIWNNEAKCMVLDALVSCRLLAKKHSRSGSVCVFFGVVLHLLILVSAVLGSGSIVTLLAIREGPIQTASEVCVAVFYHLYVIFQSFGNWMRFDRIARAHHLASSKYFKLSNQLEIALTYRVTASTVESTIRKFSYIQKASPPLPIWIHNRRLERQRVREEFIKRFREHLSVSEDSSSCKHNSPL